MCGGSNRVHVSGNISVTKNKMKTTLVILSILATQGMAATIAGRLRSSHNQRPPVTYLMSGNLVCTVAQPAISINSPRAGKIIVDLGGFQLSASGVTSLEYQF